VLLEEFLGISELVNILPAATGIGLHVGREAGVRKNAFPVERVGEVREGFVACIGREFVRRDDGRFWNGHPQLRHEAVVEVFFIRAPPERVVDDRRSRESRILEPGPVEGNVLGDPVEDDGVAGGLSLHGLVDPDGFRADVLDSFTVDLLDKRHGK
jgi:hypothetical protein